MKNIESIVHEGVRYFYEHRVAKHKVDTCLATKDPKAYCNGTYLYSSKDPGSGLAFVVVDQTPAVSVLGNFQKVVKEKS